MATRPSWTRERVKRYLVQRFYTRFHMSLILASSGLAAMLASWALLHAGVHAMLVRYPVATGIAYLTFLSGVWLWLRYAGLGRGPGVGRTLLENADLPDLPVGGGSGGSGGGSIGGLGKGGSFDGGGASASWAQGARAPMMPANVQAQALAAGSAPDSTGDTPALASSGGKSGGGFSLGDFGDLDGDAIALLALALAVIAAIFLASGYLIWFAPDILSEAAFGAVLAGGLARRSRHEDAGGWIAGVVKKTWWPFAIVLAVAIAFAWFCATHYPQARTFKEAVSMAVAT
jgi:hypothetical protein